MRLQARARGHGSRVTRGQRHGTTDLQGPISPRTAREPPGNRSLEPDEPIAPPRILLLGREREKEVEGRERWGGGGRRREDGDGEGEGGKREVGKGREERKNGERERGEKDLGRGRGEKKVGKWRGV